MAEQQAAEALVAVGRQNSGGANVNPAPSPGIDESMAVDDTEDLPKKKRVRRTKRDREREAEMETVGIPNKDTSQPPHSGESSESADGESPSRWIDDAVMNESSPTASHPQPAPPSQHSQPRHSPPRYTQPPPGEDRYPALSRGRFASPHGGLELPPLNSTLTSHRGRTEAGGDESQSYRKGGGSPSRPRSPSSYHLPPPNFFHGRTSPPSGPTRSQPRSYSPTSHPESFSQRHRSGSRSPPITVPTIAELERHYGELRSERRRLEDLLATTDRMIVGIKRGLDDMRAASGEGSPGSGSGSRSVSSGDPPATRLRGKSGERAESGSVWAWEASSSHSHS
ncbi:hypothetical protein BOTBODRAFT_170988 [Botryobasidium botryosum FD-172 SS1]|uniref:Uncharacterized protein n=1 Tax=Botryobasidium botryosum (strain FD-172 SS1) TaxID=930990 RepID=A0A067N4F5_BOTB1|nr:hypothetical protein BOTBODRAFT_170988 [Botryobasidium botryosum FD-172 SS1]